jgi:dihydropteroate synthase
MGFRENLIQAVRKLICAKQSEFIPVQGAPVTAATPVRQVRVVIAPVREQREQRVYFAIDKSRSGVARNAVMEQIRMQYGAE